MNKTALTSAAVVTTLVVILGVTDPGLAGTEGHDEPNMTSQEMMDGTMGAQSTQGQGMIGGMAVPSLMMPMMDPRRGRELFASKGCVTCHSINGVGGEDARPLDAAEMQPFMNPFEFAARMWRGAEAMVELQRDTLGEPIDLSGQDLADIIAFVHHTEQQRLFSETDIPPRMRELMDHGHDDDADKHMGDEMEKKDDHSD